MVAMERTWLDVPFDDKDAAKTAGARWDPAVRRWYAPRPGLPGLARWTARPPLPELLPGEDRDYGEGLFVDLIPQTSWFRNVRAAVDPADWDRLRRLVYQRAGYRCETCGAAEDRGHGIQLEAHERFAYDITCGIQRLVRLICLCTACHRVTHFGHTMLLGDVPAQAAINHMQTVTAMTDSQAERHIRDAFARWERRSAIRWRVDLSLMTGVGIRLREPTQEPVVYDDEPEDTEPGMLIITAITGLPDPLPAARRPSVPEPEAGPATRALAKTYERYARELAAIEALRGHQRSV
jgi:hypothetical protein